MSEVPREMSRGIRDRLKGVEVEAFTGGTYLKSDEVIVDETTEIDLCIVGKEGFAEGVSITQSTINPKIMMRTTEIYDLEGNRYTYQKAPYTDDMTMPRPGNVISDSRDFLSSLDLACAKQLLALYDAQQ